VIRVPVHPRGKITRDSSDEDAIVTLWAGRGDARRDARDRDRHERRDPQPSHRPV